MSFQQNSFQQNAFQAGVSGGTAPQEPFKPSPSLSAPRAPSSQGGYSTVPNLLVTTLALFAAASQDVKRDATLQNTKAPTAVQAFQPPNLLTETLGTQVVAPVGDQSLQSAPSVNNLNEWQQYHNPLLFKLPLPQGQQNTDSAPPPINIGAAQQNQSRLVLEQVVQPIPIGHQQTDSAPTVNRVLYWDKGTNTLLFTLPLPVGKGQIESAPIQKADVSAEQTQSRAILDQAEQPIPIGEQRTDSQVTRPQVQTFTPEQIIPPTVVQAELPPGHQSTDSSPPTPRIGEMIYARGVDPGPPAPESDPLPIGKQETDSAPPRPNPVDSFRSPTIIPPIVVAAELPIGDQKTDSAPYTIFRPLIDEPQNLLAGPLGLQPVASIQSEGMPTIRPSQVFLWLPPNVTINLPVPVIEIPVGDQRTENQVTRPAVTVFTPPQIQPPVQNPIPVGHQQTDSAPIPAPAVQSYTAPVIIPPISGPLPIGGQRSESAPIWAVPIGTSVGWTIPPDLLPPGVDIPLESPRVINLAPGWPLRFLVYINGKPHYGTQEEIDELLDEVAEKDAEKPKKTRTRIVVQQGKPIFEKVPAPNKAQLLQFQSNFRDHYLKAYAKYKLEEDDEDDWLLLL